MDSLHLFSPGLKWIIDAWVEEHLLADTARGLVPSNLLPLTVREFWSDMDGWYEPAFKDLLSPGVVA